MIKKLILTALLSGIIAGTILTGLQAFKTVPLIHQAEQYESKDLIIYSKAKHLNNVEHKSKDIHHKGMNEEDMWSPNDGIERTTYTLISNIVLAIGFSFILLSLYLYINNLNIKKAIVSGIVGYLVFFALPSLGLHPELPGTLAASLHDRQTWWIDTVLASAIGFLILFFNKNNLFKLMAIFIIALPHIVGAPHSSIHAGTAPFEMLESFEISSFITNGIFWIILSIITVILFNKQKLKVEN